jgi:hypothetical protein
MSKERVKSYLKHVCEPMYRVLDESGGLVTRPGDVELGAFCCLDVRYICLC